MDTQVIQLRFVPLAVARSLKIKAMEKGMSLENYVTELLAKAVHKDGKKQ